MPRSRTTRLSVPGISARGAVYTIPDWEFVTGATILMAARRRADGEPGQ